MIARLVTAMTAATLLSGIIGGLIATRLRPPTPAAAQPADLTAGRFTLLDQTGIQRGTLEVTGSGAARLAVTGPNSQTPRVTVAADSAGPRLLLADTLGATRVAIEIQRDGTALVGAYGLRGEGPAATLGVDGAGSTALTLRDREGRVRASLALAPDGSPSLVLLGEDGSPLWMAP